MTAVANHELVDRIRTQLLADADPQRAVGARKYMRDQFLFLGVPSPKVKLCVRAALQITAGPLSQAELRDAALALWQLPEREYQYAACFLLQRFAKSCDPPFIDTARYLIVTKSWWDTVDTLASHTVGTLVRNHPQLVAVMDEWIDDENIWLARTALLHQLGSKEDTDAERLFRYCLRRADHPDFFMRKAIGWALRQYAWIEPDPVRAFVRAHESALSPLSRREALKNIG